MTTTANLFFGAGETATLEFEIQDESGQVPDLSLWDARIRFAKRFEDVAVAEYGTTSHPLNVWRSSSGFVLSLPPDETRILLTGTYQFVVTERATGVATRVYEGRVTVTQEIRGAANV